MKFPELPWYSKGVDNITLLGWTLLRHSKENARDYGGDEGERIDIFYIRKV